MKVEAKKAHGGKNVMSGKSLFQYDPTLFKDDEDAAEETAYEVIQEEEETKEEETKEGESNANVDGEEDGEDK